MFRSTRFFKPESSIHDDRFPRHRLEKRAAHSHAHQAKVISIDNSAQRRNPRTVIPHFRVILDIIDQARHDAVDPNIRGEGAGQKACHLNYGRLGESVNGVGILHGRRSGKIPRPALPIPVQRWPSCRVRRCRRQAGPSRPASQWGGGGNIFRWRRPKGRR